MLMDCTVDVSGTRFNDADPDAPVILSGLKLIWGRATTVDQPAPATCTFTIADWTGDPNTLERLPVGALVDVNAAGLDYGAPTTGTFDDPTLTRLRPAYAPGATLTLHPDGSGLTSTAKSPTSGNLLYVRPDDPSANVSAWVGIPRLAPGQNWALRLTGTAPYGALCRPYMVPLATPATTPATLSPTTGQHLIGAFDVTVPFVPPAVHAGEWAGAGLEASNYSTWATIAAATGLTTWAQQPQTWIQMLQTTLTRVDVLTPAAERILDVRVFSGRITDVQAQYDEGLGALVADVTSTDFTADLANRRVAAAPWPKEAADARINRILTAAASSASVQIAPGLHDYQLAPDDVDAQSPTALLEQVAVSVDAVMWAATSDPTGEYLLFENLSARPSGMSLQLVGGRVYVMPDGAAAGALPLDACAVLREPVTWRQDSADVLTRVGTRWLEAGVDTDGQPTETERTEWLVDTPREPAYGVRALSVGTQLTTRTDAETIGGLIAGRVFGPAWRVDGLTIEGPALADTGTTAGGVTPTAILAELLDGTRRIGRLTELTNLPAWSPGLRPPAAAMIAYLEGGAYSYSNEAWTLTLGVSGARGQGPSLTWQDLATDQPTWAWQLFSPTVDWSELVGVSVHAPAATTPAWPGIAYPGITYPGEAA